MPWAQDAIALQVDLDQNLVFAGAQETGFARVPNMVDGKAQFDYNWSRYSQYAAGTYGVKADFTNSNFYFTGNQSSQFCHQPVPTLTSQSSERAKVLASVDDASTIHRGVNRTVEVRLVDNSLQPPREVPVTYSWDADGIKRSHFHGQEWHIPSEPHHWSRSSPGSIHSFIRLILEICCINHLRAKQTSGWSLVRISIYNPASQ